MQEFVDALINCVSRHIGFSQGKPVAALTIYKCLLHWKSFEAEKTSVFDRLIQMVGSAIEVICCLYVNQLFILLLLTDGTTSQLINSYLHIGVAALIPTHLR